MEETKKAAEQEAAKEQPAPKAEKAEKGDKKKIKALEAELEAKLLELSGGKLKKD